jgi:hypothetical protein
MIAILKFLSTSCSMGHLCWSKSAPPPETCHLSPPPLSPMRQRSVIMGAAITVFRLPVISYQAYTKIPKSVRPPRLLLLVLILLLVVLTLLLCTLLVLLVLLTTVTTGIMFILLILLPPGTLTTVVLPIRNSVTQFLVQATRNYLPSPIQTLFSALSGLQKKLFNRDELLATQTTPNVVPVPNVVVTPTCLLNPPPQSPTIARPRTLRRSKSWLRW